MLWKNPAVTAIAVVSLTIGIGANTAAFAAAKAALLGEIAVPHPEQLRLLAYAQPERSIIQNDLGDFYTESRGRKVMASSRTRFIGSYTNAVLASGGSLPSSISISSSIYLQPSMAMPRS